MAAIINAILILSQSSGSSWEKFINGIEEEKFNDGAKMTSFIVDGISSRLESSSAQSRAHATLIAKQFSLAMDPEKSDDVRFERSVNGETDLLDPDKGENDVDDDDGYRSANEVEWESNVKVALDEYDASEVLPTSFYESETAKDEWKNGKVSSIEIEEANEEDDDDEDEEDEEEFQAYDIDSDDDDELTQKQTNAKNLKRHLRAASETAELRAK